MAEIAPLIELRRRTMWNTFRGFRTQPPLKIILVAVLGGAIWSGLFLFPYYGFEWMARELRESSFSNLLISLFFFLLMIMLVFSNTVIAYTALFRSEEAVFLQSTPVRPGTLYIYKLVESLTFSSWAFFILGLPIMLAFGAHKDAPWYYYAAIPVFFLAFILIPAAVGSLLALVLSFVLRQWMRRVFTWIAVLTIFSIAVFGPGYLRSFHKSFLLSGLITQKISFSHSMYLPSAWVGRGLSLFAERPLGEAAGEGLYFFSLLLSNSLLLCLIAYGVAEGIYRRAWNVIQSSAAPPRWKFSSSSLGRGPASPLFHLLVKDLKTFRRDPVQWIQCLVLFGLLAMYILNLRNLRFPEGSPANWRYLTTFLNLASICLVLATLTTRFVFPMFSLEGTRFWILGLVPIPRSRVLWSKFLFSFIGSLAVTETLAYLSDYMLGESRRMTQLHMATVGMISCGLSGLAVGLSALYPNLRETSPAKIVSGFGGTLNLILSLLYVIIVISLEGYIAIRYLQHGATVYHLLIPIAVLILLTAAAVAIPMGLGVRAVRQMEF